MQKVWDEVVSLAFLAAPIRLYLKWFSCFCGKAWKRFLVPWGCWFVVSKFNCISKSLGNVAQSNLWSQMAITTMELLSWPCFRCQPVTPAWFMASDVWLSVPCLSSHMWGRCSSELFYHWPPHSVLPLLFPFLRQAEEQIVWVSSDIRLTLFPCVSQ